MVDKNNIQVFNTGKVVDLETTAALIPEITLMYHGENINFKIMFLSSKVGKMIL